MANTTNDVITGDPLVSFHFAIDFGKVTGYFSEVSGIGSETEVTDVKVTDAKGRPVIRKIPGRLKWGEITLKRGITSNMDFYQWRKQVEDGLVDAARTDCSIIMYDQAGKEIARWNVFKAWPSKISGPSIKSDSSEVGVEELTLVHEGIMRAK
jgi:phage tail-like protein